MVSEAKISVTAFDALSSMAAGAVLEPVCGSLAWVVALVATRPHHTLEMVRTRSDEALAAVEWSDVQQALGADPGALAGPDEQPEVRRRLATDVRRRLADALEDVDPPTVAPMWISLDGAENVRDLGGLPTEDGGHVRPGVLVRSDSLQELSEADVRRLVDELHVTAVADLRTGVELRGEGPGPLTREPAVDVVHLSLFPEAGTTTDAEAVPDEGPVVLPWQGRDTDDAPRRTAAEVYASYLDDRSDSILAALRLIATTDGATIVHCAAGKDRTGTVVALALREVGVTREAVVADYARSAERVERVFARLAQRRTYAGDISTKIEDAAKHKPRAETMDGLLAAVDDRHGGVDTWLRSHGWTDEDAAALRAKLLA